GRRRKSEKLWGGASGDFLSRACRENTQSLRCAFTGRRVQASWGANRAGAKRRGFLHLFRTSGALRQTSSGKNEEGHRTGEERRRPAKSGLAHRRRSNRSRRASRRNRSGVRRRRAAFDFGDR